MVVEESMTKPISISMLWYSVSSKASGLFYKWQWWSLWRSLFLSLYCVSLILVKPQVVTINGRDGTMPEPIYICMLSWSVFSKGSGVYYKWQWWSLWRNLFLSPYCSSLFLVKLQVLTINDGDVICGGTYFHLHDEVLCFQKSFRSLL